MTRSTGGGAALGEERPLEMWAGAQKETGGKKRERRKKAATRPWEEGGGLEG